jgi:hypothetical protein
VSAKSSSGYDLVVESSGVIRHIQLKASHRLAKTAELDIHVGLQGKPSACVIWIRFDADSCPSSDNLRQMAV